MTQKQSLSDALKALEKIVSRLESTDFDIEEGLKEFRTGVDLVEFCRGELKSAENEFVELKSRLEKNSEKSVESENHNLEDVH